jgi:hypothetical protein
VRATLVRLYCEPVERDCEFFIVKMLSMRYHFPMVSKKLKTLKRRNEMKIWLQDFNVHDFGVTGCKMSISKELKLRFQDFTCNFSMNMCS